MDSRRQDATFSTYAWFFLLFRRAALVVAMGAMSCESSGRASASGLISPTTGVACRRASAACCSLACLMELISGEEAKQRQGSYDDAQ